MTTQETRMIGSTALLMIGMQPELLGTAHDHVMVAEALERSAAWARAWRRG